MPRRCNLIDKNHLSFSIGPVQTFVAQSRRTRDLWAGSILLSWLAESALVAVEERFQEKFDNRSATTIIPNRFDSRGELTSIECGFGGIPNRFEIEFDSADDAAQAGQIAQQGFRRAWEKVCEAVWEVICNVKDQGNATEAIWNRQTQKFWELSWIVATPSGRRKTIGDFAAARKLIRDVSVTEEGGVKCSLMHEWQELSGYHRSQEQIAFWTALQNCRGVGRLNIRDGERLCAMALIKRLLPSVDEQVFGRSLQQKNWPSTAFLAAVPWLQEVQQSSAALQVADAYVGAAAKAGVHQSEFEAAKDAGVPWAKVDGPAWWPGAIAGNEWGISDEDQKALSDQLHDVYRIAGDRKPVPFYALLLMDGDSIGKLLDAIDSPTELSRCLNRFTSTVNQTVQKHGGRTVYAGGDDVMAILPAGEALAAADRLSHQYKAAFADVLKGKVGIEATISTAIVYSHWKQPLHQVLQHAHRLLDDVAKTATGRDAVAIGVVKGSGLNAQWAAPWETVREHKIAGGVDSIIHRFKDSPNPDGKNESVFNASFVYHLRTQFSRLLGDTLDRPGSFGLMHETIRDADEKHDMLLALANAEYRRRLSDEDRSRLLDDTRDTVKPLIELTRHFVRGRQPDRGKVGFDGWRVARFLKQVHDGEMQDHE